jgi:hypothetical protein
MAFWRYLPLLIPLPIIIAMSSAFVNVSGPDLAIFSLGLSSAGQFFIELEFSFKSLILLTSIILMPPVISL